MLQDACIGPHCRRARGGVVHSSCGSLGVLCQSNATGLSGKWHVTRLSPPEKRSTAGSSEDELLAHLVIQLLPTLLDTDTDRYTDGYRFCLTIKFTNMPTLAAAVLPDLISPGQQVAWPRGHPPTRIISARFHLASTCLFSVSETQWAFSHPIGTPSTSQQVWRRIWGQRAWHLPTFSTSMAP